MKSSSDGCERSVTLTRRTATVIISAPLRSNAAAISSLSRYFPVPMIRRELNSRPAMMSLSFMLRHCSHRDTEIRREGETRRRGDKETDVFLLFSLSPCLPVSLSFSLRVSVSLWPFLHPKVCRPDSSKDRHLHGQVLPRVLAEIVKQFRHLGREVVRIVIKARVFEHHSHRAFALLQARHDEIQPLDPAAHVGVEFVIVYQSADRSLAALDLGDYVFQPARRLVEPGDERAGVVVELIILEKLADVALAGAKLVFDLVGDVAQLGDGLGRLFVKRRVADQLAHSPLAGLDFLHEALGLAHGAVEVYVERLVVEKLTCRSLAGLHIPGHISDVGGYHVEVADRRLRGVDDVADALLGHAGNAVPVLDRLARDGARGDVNDVVAEHPGALKHGHRIGADALDRGSLAKLAVNIHDDLNAALRIRGVRDLTEIDLSDAAHLLARKAHFRALAQPVDVRHLSLDGGGLADARQFDVAADGENDEDQNSHCRKNQNTDA